MGLFSKKTKEEVKVEKPVVKAVKKVAKKDKAVKPASTAAKIPQLVIPGNSVILRPHITEKAGTMAERLNTYVFEVHKDANKRTVAAAVSTLYKVTPAKVHVINKRAEEVFVRGKHGHHKAMKKAMVTLKKGDKIELA